MAKKCPRCMSASIEHLEAPDHNHATGSEYFIYRRCTKCRLVFIESIPNDLGRFYSESYAPYDTPTNVEELSQRAAAISWRVDMVRTEQERSNSRPLGTLLDIGPSYGAFLFAAQASGYAVDAIEMDGACCEFISKAIPSAHVVQSDDVSAALGRLERNYDVITMWHNIEHLSNPWETLQQISSKLVPGGLLCISTPNPLSLQFALFRENWVHLDAPRHISLIPEPTLTTHLAALGLRRCCVTTTDPDGLALNRMSWGWSMIHATSLDRSSLLRKALSRAAEFLAIPIEIALGAGCAYTAIYRKIDES